ncbi:MAG: metallophosphoesterase [Candidatus Micrarchaeota archaeon]|nr:metallophosphoesterase [Candidatus Micrarchaeota archaeon]
MMHPWGAIILDGAVVASDLHLGLELSLGLPMELHTKRILQRLQTLLKKYDANLLILAGDVKDDFGMSHIQPLRYFFREIFKDVDIVVTKGNHDNYIEAIIGDWADIVESYRYKEYIISHGHKEIDPEGKTLIIGNDHPIISFRTKTGGKRRYRAFLKFEDLIVMPSFNWLSPGNDVLRTFKYSSPNLKKKDINEAEVWVSDEEELYNFGKLGQLRLKLDELSPK